MRDRARSIGRRMKAGGAAACLAALAALLGPSTAHGQRRPFFIGERLTYQVHVSKLGNVGRGSMWVEGPMELRGTSAFVLHFDFQTRVGPVKAVNRSESWIDPLRMRALRFVKHERHPLAKHDERVELFPEQRRWEGLAGESGESPTDLPLDELSFMYFLRTVPLDADSVYGFDRHFDALRNPVGVKVIRRETIETEAGQFAAVLIEMRVRDPRRYRGEGVIRIHFSDDERRLPVRIESSMPVLGKAVLSLETFNAQPREVADSTP